MRRAIFLRLAASRARDPGTISAGFDPIRVCASTPRGVGAIFSLGALPDRIPGAPDPAGTEPNYKIDGEAVARPASRDVHLTLVSHLSDLPAAAHQQEHRD